MSVDHKRLPGTGSQPLMDARLSNIGAWLTRDSDLSSDEALSLCHDEEDYARLAGAVGAMLDQSQDLLFRARLYKLLSCLMIETQRRGIELEKPVVEGDSVVLEDKAFEAVRRAIAQGLKWDALPSQKQIGIRSDEVVWVCASARLDLGGGWSDTPPHCLEKGGHVLNAAVKLNDQYPVQVIAKIYPEPVIRINSIDLGKSVVLSKMSDLLSYSDPADWLSLPKSAFVAAGLVSEGDDDDLRERLQQFGGGIDLTLFSAVPSGSGLGTSSILGAAIIACLARMFGFEFSRDDLFNRTLYTEQLMTTGGGWQDQIGGVVGGVKLIRTQPGLFQEPSISWTDLRQPGLDLSDRFLLYYTGYRRMAKNILRQIVSKYLTRDPATLELLRQNQRLAIEMKEVLDRRDIDAFGEKLAEVWKLQNDLDPDTSNANIADIFDRIHDDLLGAKLLGAGGGGFLFIVTKSREHSRRIRERLIADPPNDRARFFDLAIDDEGMKVSVL